MNNGVGSRRILRYGGIALAIVLILYLAWVISSGWGTSTLVAGIAVLLFVAAMIYLRQMDLRSDAQIKQRIRAEYLSESQPQVLELYEHLKTKELEYLFVKVLDDAKGNLNEVKKLAGLAESIGPKAFLETHW